MLDPAIVGPRTLRPLSRREYDRLVELGMFRDEKLELLRGALVAMSPQDWPHAITVQWLTNQIVRQLPAGFDVRPQLPFAADDWSEPEPDLAVVRADYTTREHPSEVLLLIEVADSSLRIDRGLKRELYAGAKVPEYWVIDVNTQTVAVHTDPVDGAYASCQVLREGDVLRPTRLPTVALPVADLPR